MRKGVSRCFSGGMNAKWNWSALNLSGNQRPSATISSTSLSMPLSAAGAARMERGSAELRCFGLAVVGQLRIAAIVRPVTAALPIIYQAGALRDRHETRVVPDLGKIRAEQDIERLRERWRIHHRKPLEDVVGLVELAERLDSDPRQGRVVLRDERFKPASQRFDVLGCRVLPRPNVQLVGRVK